MSAIPEGIETDAGPPLSIPLCHFLLALGFLVAAGVVWTLQAAGVAPGRGRIAYRHLLLAGWVCLTIAGAMTQFVPVWSGVPLHSRRLARAQLGLLSAGIGGMVLAWLTGRLQGVAVGGVLALAGLWTLAYNVGRTLAAVDGLDVTELHFAVALAWFAVVPVFGLALAASYAAPGVLSSLAVARTDLLAAHASAAVFGAVLTTAVGALYQLATMFTRTELSRLDRAIQRAETAAYPLGVTALVAGRLTGMAPLARVGGVAVLGSLAAVGFVLSHRLLAARVEWRPMLSRYAVVAAALPVWAALTAPGWLADPLAYRSLLGPPPAATVLLLGVIGFLVVGTLYHVVPFVVWFHRYSDRLGLAAVPMIDDLYDDRLAVVDFWLLAAGGAALVLAGGGVGPAALAVAGPALVTAGAVVFAANLLLVVRGHGPGSLGWLVAGSSPAE